MIYVEGCFLPTPCPIEWYICRAKSSDFEFFQLFLIIDLLCLSILLLDNGWKDHACLLFMVFVMEVRLLQKWNYENTGTLGDFQLLRTAHWRAIIVLWFSKGEHCEIWLREQGSIVWMKFVPFCLNILAIAPFMLVSCRTSNISSIRVQLLLRVWK